MKTCPNCTSELEDDFDLCWNCQYSFAEQKVLGNSDYLSICPKCNMEVKSYLNHCPYCHEELRGSNREGGTKPGSRKQVDCSRCGVALDFQGNFKFNEDSGGGPAGNLLGVFINNESLDVYNCPVCGKVEFFLPGFE